MTAAPRRRIVEKLGFQIAFVLAAALLPLTAISMINALRAAREIHASSEVALTGETMLAAASEVRMIQEARGSAAAIASLIGPLVGDEAACSAALRAFVATHDTYSQASFVPVSGLLVCSSSGKHLDVSKSPIFQDTVRAARPSFAANRNGALSGTSVLGVSHPVLDADGRYLGYVGLSLPHSKLAVEGGTADTARPLELMTFDRDGEVLAASGGLDMAAAALPRDRQLVTLKTDHPTAFSALSQSGQSRVFSIVPLVPGELFALGTWPADDGTSVTQMLLSVPFLAPALIWIGSLVVAWLSVERLVNRPIRRLNVAINAFARGSRMGPGVDVTGAPLEIREIANAFEQMTEAVTHDEAELEDTLHQKEVLLREVHHRVKNNLQMMASIMNMQGRKARTPETRQVIKGLQGRVMSLATIHRELYQTMGGGDVHAAELLDAIARQTVAAAAGADRRFDLQQHFDDIRMTPDQAVPLALLVGEGLMNALSRTRPPTPATAANPARPDTAPRTPTPATAANSDRPDTAPPALAPPTLAPLVLRLTRTAPDRALLEIETRTAAADHPPSADLEEATGFSEQLMAAFAKQIGGTLHQTLTPETYTLSIPFPLRPLVEGEYQHQTQTQDG